MQNGSTPVASRGRWYYPAAKRGGHRMSSSLALKPLSRKQERIIETILVQRDDPTGRADVQYMHAVLAQVSLPRKRVEGLVFTRTSGKVSIRLEAGSLWNGRDFEQQPLPYGSMPRLILAWLSTQAVLRRSRSVPVGSSAADFMRLMGYSSISGGKTGNYSTFAEQSRALAAVRMTLGSGLTTVNGQPVTRFEAWAIDDNGKQALWPDTIELSQEYYDSLIERAVPLSAIALNALKGSSLALDIYAWLAHRLYRVRAASGDGITWASLKEQFGQEYAEDAQGRKNFRRKFEEALGDVRRLYPTARVECLLRDGHNAGVLLLPSPTPVSKSG